jgi:hypothetical protein
MPRHPTTTSGTEHRDEAKRAPTVLERVETVASVLSAPSLLGTGGYPYSLPFVARR